MGRTARLLLLALQLSLLPLSLLFPMLLFMQLLLLLLEEELLLLLLHG